MQISVGSLMQEGIGSTRKYELDETVVFEGIGPRRVSGGVALLRTRSGVLVRAHFTELESEVCSRCLKPVDEVITIEFEEEYHATVDMRTGRHLARPQDADAFLIDEHFNLDLDDALRQYREVSLVLAPLCREDCKGLCPTCGADLNLVVCDCAQLPGDVRWSSLAALHGAIRDGKDR